MSRVTLADGSSWPLPYADALDGCDNGDDGALWRLRYGTATRADMLLVLEIVVAYRHLTAHPSGTEAAIKKLRMLRRAVAEVSP